MVRHARATLLKAHISVRPMGNHFSLDIIAAAAAAPFNSRKLTAL